MEIGSFHLDGLDLEMEPDEGEHQALQILQHVSQRSQDFRLREVLQHLDQIVETAETVRVSRLVDINLRNRLNLFLPSFSYGYQAANLAGCERDVLVPNHNLKLLEVVVKLVAERNSSMRQ